ELPFTSITAMHLREPRYPAPTPPPTQQANSNAGPLTSPRRPTRQAGRPKSVVDERSPLLALEVQVEVFEWADASHSEPEVRWQPGCRPRVDQEPGAVRQSARCEFVGIVPSR